MKNRIMVPMTALVLALAFTSAAYSSKGKPATNKQASETKDKKTKDKKKEDTSFEEIDFKQVKDGAIVAKVNGKEISVEEVFQVMQSLPPELKQIPLELLFMATRDQLVDMYIIQAEANKKADQLKKTPEVQEAMKGCINLS